MQFSLKPLFIAVAVAGFLVGLLAGGLGGVLLWPDPPCPACPVVVCPEPTPCPVPEVKMVEATPEPGDESAPSAFYRGWLASCISNGQLAEAPMEATVKYCRAHLLYGIEGGWFDAFRPDNWSWPPPFLEGDTQPKSAGP